MSNPFIIQTPVIFLENQEDQAVSASILRLEVKLSENGRCSADLQLNNWGEKNGILGYLYFNDVRFATGKSLAIRVGAQVLFDGLILEINAQYTQSTPTTIGMTATSNRAIGISSTTQLAYGQNLVTFEVKECWQAERFPSISRRRRTLSGSGSAEYSGQLAPGGKVNLIGIGDKFSGEYSLSEVIHRYDRVSGWRTQFAVGRIGQ
jgi:hypothetical protein